jgi:hypothetical protein
LLQKGEEHENIQPEPEIKLIIEGGGLGTNLNNVTRHVKYLIQHRIPLGQSQAAFHERKMREQGPPEMGNNMKLIGDGRAIDLAMFISLTSALVVEDASPLVLVLGRISPPSSSPSSL